VDDPQVVVGPEKWIVMWYGLGFAFAIAVAVMLGGSYVREHGRRLVPLIAVLTLVAGGVLGWSIDEVMKTLYAPAFSH
jgi:prolipoprotein diacylglyceryltransferase